MIQLISGAVWIFMSAMAAMTDEYYMSPDIYGEAVTSVNAEVWTYPLLISTIIYVFGIFINGNWRWSPFLRLFGSSVQLTLLTLFGVLSFNYDNIDPFTVSCFSLASFVLWCVYLNLGDAWRALQGVGWNERNRPRVS